MTDQADNVVREMIETTGGVRIFHSQMTHGTDPTARPDPTFQLHNPSGIIPTEFKVLILPDPIEEVSKGGIIIPIEKAEKDKYATTDGTIIAISHLAFTYATDEEWGAAKPKAGDRVAFAKYAGARRKAKDGKDYLLVNDKDIVAVLTD